jgi:hypothetical protein
VDLDRVSLEELAYARYVDFHEGRRPPYGAVIAGADSPTRPGTTMPPLPSAAAFVDKDAPLRTVRQFADGRTAFLARGSDGSHALVIDRQWAATSFGWLLMLPRHDARSSNGLPADVCASSAEIGYSATPTASG